MHGVDAGVASKLKDQSGGDIVLAGGPSLAQSFTRLGLIDEYQIVVHPALVGAGKPLFRDSGELKRLRLVESLELTAGAVLLKYEPAKP